MRLVNSKNFLKVKHVLFGIVFISLFLACGGTEEENLNDSNESEEQISKSNTGAAQNTSSPQRALPEVHGLDLAKLFANPQGLSLNADEEANKCAWTEERGIFGIPLGVACHSVPLVAELLYGSSDPDKNKDGSVTCEDYVFGDSEQGILFEMLCHPGMKANDRVESLRFKEKNLQEFAISFKDFNPEDQFTALGHWSAYGSAAGRYPANIMAWHSQGEGSDLEGILALKLESSQQGKISLDGRASGHNIVGEIEFGQGSDPSQCLESPSKSNCIWQDIKITMPGEETSSIHLFIMSEKKKDAEFVLMEGKILLEEATSAKWFTGEDEFGENLIDTREIYFRTVVKPEQIWGTIDFKDETSARITGSNAVNVVLDLLRDGPSETPYTGVCQNQGSGNIAPCDQIDYLEYNLLWSTDELFAASPFEYDLGIDFTDIPEEQGLKKASPTTSPETQAE
ncbi:MAG: hypothetical protein AB8G05_22710 [Oligoflexales bacterium]